MTVVARERVDTRERLLRATLAVVGADGVGGVTNRAVAAEAGVALGSLTYHFPSQDELLRESLLLFVEDEVSRLRGFVAGLDERLTRDEPVALAGQVTEILREVSRPEHLAQFELYLHAARDAGLRDAVRRCHDAYDEVAAAVLRALGIDDEAPYVPALVALIDGYELRRLALGTEPDPPLTELLAAFVALARAQIR